MKITKKIMQEQEFLEVLERMTKNFEQNIIEENINYNFVLMVIGRYEKKFRNEVNELHTPFFANMCYNQLLEMHIMKWSAVGYTIDFKKLKSLCVKKAAEIYVQIITNSKQ